MARTFKNKPTIGNSNYGLAAAGATLLLAAASAHAQYADNIFLDFNAGGAFQQDLSVQSGFNGEPGHIKFSPGWCLSGDVGYSVTPQFSTDLEIGAIWNNVTTIGNQSLSGVASAHLVEVPILLNGIFTYPVGHFKPYLGLGLGAAIGNFASSDIPGSGQRFGATDVTFAYQVQVGLKYSLNQNMDLGLGYKFFGTSTHDWTNNGISLNTGGSLAHLIEATFTWRF